MDYGQSYTATWRVFRVNRDTWADGEQLTGVDSTSFTRTVSGNLLESGSMSLTGEFESDYYRIVMTAEQSGEIERVDVATLLFQAKGGTVDFGTVLNSVDGYSVLYPASVTSVITGQYAPAGIDGAQYAAQLLRGAINAPVQIEGSFTLNEHIVHDIGSSVLDAVWAVLDAGGFVIQIDGRGIVHIMPKPTQPSLILNSSNVNMMTNGINFTTDVSKLPNRYIVIDGNNVTTAVNDDPDSEISTVVRGYYVDLVDESPTPINGETYGSYARRMLKQSSVMKDEREYTREFAPDVYAYSIVTASITGLQGDLRVASQTIECNNGITVHEKAVREVELWNYLQ